MAGPKRNTGNRPAPSRTGRRIAQAVYYSMVAAIAIASTWQITRQVFSAPRHVPAASFRNCDDGLRALHASIAKAREAAESGFSESRNQETPLLRFRAALEPSWRHRDNIASMCTSTTEKGLLDAIERLRYSEEHGVRHQVAELGAIRRRVHALVTTHLSSGPTWRGTAPHPIEPTETLRP